MTPSVTSTVTPSSDPSRIDRIVSIAQILRPKFRSATDGIRLSDASVRGCVYENCFIGKQAVTWITEEVCEGSMSVRESVCERERERKRERKRERTSDL